MRKLVVTEGQEKFIQKAVKDLLTNKSSEEFPDATDEFISLNPAAKQLVDEWDVAYKIFSDSLKREINKVLLG